MRRPLYPSTLCMFLAYNFEKIRLTPVPRGFELSLLKYAI